MSCWPGSAPDQVALRSSDARAPVETQNATRARSRFDAEPGEQLVERAVGDLPRHPLGHPWPEQPRLLLRERVQRVVMRVRPPRPGQRERVHDRPRPGLQMICVEAAADRLAVRRRRRRVLPRRTSRPAVPRQARTVSELKMPAEVPGLGPGRLVPRDAHRPGEPEPAQQRKRVRPLRRRRTARRLQVPQVLRYRPDPDATRSLSQHGSHGSPVSTSAPAAGTTSDPRSRNVPSSSPSVMVSDRNDRHPGTSGES